MLGSAVKKAFFDLWDHLYFALGVNLVYTLVLLGLISLAPVFQGLGTLGLLVFLPLPALVSALLGGVATYYARDIALTGSVRFRDFLPHLSASWKPSLFFGLGWLVLGAGFLFGVPFYASVNPVVGFVFGVLMAWAVFFAAGLGLYYPGLNAQVEPSLRKLVRKAFLLFLANPGLSMAMFLGLVILVAASGLTLGFFPGILGISLWLQVCFKFLLAKYEWMEANPNADHKKVPWTAILADDMEKVGPRSLRNMIFPWKD